MSQPTSYDRQNSFTTLASVSPSTPYTGAQLDAEFNAVKVTLDEVLANLALIQRDDGDLANQVVGPDQLAASLSIGINPPSAWAEGTDYALYDTVFNGTILYKAIVAHTSTDDFATDLANGDWEQLAEFNTVAISDGAVTTAKLADLAVTSAKIASNAVTTNKILDAAITTAKISDGAISTGKLASNSVSTAKIQDAAITTAKLADAALASIGALTPAANKLPYYTDTDTAALASITSAGLALLDDADASAQRTTLGLGTAAVANTGTSAGNVVVLDGSAKLPAVDGSQLTNLNAGGTDYQAFTSSGTWTKPSGVTSTSRVLIQVWAGGGAGGGTSGSTRGGGGGGGCYNEKWVLASDLGSTETVTVGAGGTVAAGYATAGGKGGNSSFGSIVAAKGGGGGYAQSSGSYSGGGGGGGGAVTAGSNGSNPNGGDGGTGGGGGRDGKTAAGSNGTGYMGGGGSASAGDTYDGGGAIWGGGGGAGANISDAANGGSSIMGGGGGAGGSGIGGYSPGGGAGGAVTVAGSVPGGGGGSGAAGGRGEVRVTVYK